MTWTDEGWPFVLDHWRRAASTRGEAHGMPILQAPATAAEIEALEGRLRLRLPPSYRAFLLTSNGLSITGEDSPDPGLAFLHTAGVGRVKDYFPLWFGVNDRGLNGMFDVEGNVAEQLLEPNEYSYEGHLLYAIKISGGRPEGNIFLDPLDVDADGEWRAWDRFKETCIKYRSFGEMIDSRIAALEQPDPPPFYKYVADTTPGTDERLRLEALLEQGGEIGEQAIERLVALVETGDPIFGRAPAMWVLLKSKSPAAHEAVLRLIESRPDDPVVVGNAIPNGVGYEHTDRVRRALSRALRGPNGNHYASNLMVYWPELVEEIWQEGRDPFWLRHLLSPKRPETLDATIKALADPSLPDETRMWLNYELGNQAASHPSRIEDVGRLASLAKNNRFDLARALLAWGELDMALLLVGDYLEQPDGRAIYFFMSLNELAPPAAVPALIASLRRKPTAEVLHSLSLIDHPDVVPELARQADGQIRHEALFALEQLGTARARDALAERAAGRDVEAARALARMRDVRALGSLVNQIGGAKRASAVAGLRDLRHPQSERLLASIAADDAEDNVAVIAAHGLVMMGSALGRTAAEALWQRRDPHVRKLAKHWLALLPA